MVVVLLVKCHASEMKPYEESIDSILWEMSAFSFWWVGQTRYTRAQTEYQILKLKI